MSTIVNKYPSRNVPGGGTSYWVAAHNPIIYELQRKDYTISSIQKLGSPFPPDILVTLASPVTAPDTKSIGDIVYLNSGNYVGYYTIKNTGGVLGATQFTIEGTWNGNTTGGYCNLNTVRINFHYNIEILGVENNQYYVLGEQTLFPDATGKNKLT